MTITASITGTDATDQDFMDKAAGLLVWYSFSQTEPTPQQIGAALQANGLPMHYLPTPITNLGAYQSATTGAKREYNYRGDTAHILVRPVSSEEEVVTRHLVREVTDAKGKRLSFTTIGEALFHRPGNLAKSSTGTIEVNLYSWEIDPGEQGEMDAMVAGIKNEYAFRMDHYKPSDIATMVRTMIRDLKAIAVRPTGAVYFVHRDHVPTMIAIRTFVRDLPGSSMVHSVPLVDSTEQRQMLRQSFTEEIEDEVEVLLRDLAELNATGGGEISQRAYNTITGRLADALGRAEEHDATLAIVSGRSRAAIDMAVDAVTAMASAVKAPKRAKKVA